MSYLISFDSDYRLQAPKFFTDPSEVWNIFWWKRRFYTGENIESPEFLYVGWAGHSFVAHYCSDGRNLFPYHLLTVQSLTETKDMHENMHAWKYGNI